jgi:uncharacterized protein YggE
VTVSGVGRVDAQPDQATILLGVETQAEVASNAIEQNNQQMQDLIDALTAAGVPQEDIQTQTISLTPIYQDSAPPTPAVSSSSTITEPVPPVDNEGNQIGGYRATNIVQVTTDNIDEVGMLIDAAVQAGGNRIEGIYFSVSDQSSYLSEARGAAWEQAHAQAGELAELAGAQLGRALTINDYSSPVPVVQQTTYEAAAASQVPVAPGTQSIEANLQVTWELVYSGQ